jgi:uncharacterized protein (UPF0276 family)
MDALPYLGLGLTANLDGQAPPDPWALHRARPGLFDFVEYSAPLELDPALWEGRGGLPLLFHPVHLNLWGPELEAPGALALLDAQAREVGSPWVGNDVGWWHARGEPIPGFLYVAPPLDARGLSDAVAHARHVQAHLSVPLVLENPAVIAVRGKMHVLDFMAELAARTSAPLLLDLGHLFSHQLARGLPLTAGFDGFPFERVVELHLAGGVVTRPGGRGVYVDDHTQALREELFELLAAVLPRCTQLRALTFEGDGHPEAMAARTLERLRPLAPAPGPSPAAPPVATERARGDGVGPFTAVSEPERVFAESWGRARCEEDPEGAAAEVDFRLAVLAQTLDRALPVSRLLLAGAREPLAAFARSDEFIGCFSPGATRSVVRAFCAWGRGQLRGRRDPAAEAALALESAGDHARLEEPRFCARALRRHLSGRAWATGQLELDALEGLRQVVERAVR